MERVLVEGIGSLHEVEVSAAQSLPLWWLSLMAVWPGPDTLMQPDLILVRPSQTQLILPIGALGPTETSIDFVVDCQ